jgi:hypothetical protein
LCSEIILNGISEINNNFSKNEEILEIFFFYLEKRKKIKEEGKYLIHKLKKEK